MGWSSRPDLSQLQLLPVRGASQSVHALYAATVTYVVMGRNYDSAVLAAGHIGFGLGATSTAIASMQAITSRYGHSPLAFLLVPVTGAFLIDIINALLLQGFLTLPWFGF